MAIDRPSGENATECESTPGKVASARPEAMSQSLSSFEWSPFRPAAASVEPSGPKASEVIQPAWPDKCGPQAEGRRVPEFDQPVATPGGDRPAVGAKGDRLDLTAVALQARLLGRWPGRSADGHLVAGGDGLTVGA